LSPVVGREFRTGHNRPWLLAMGSGLGYGPDPSEAERSVPRRSVSLPDARWRGWSAGPEDPAVRFSLQPRRRDGRDLSGRTGAGFEAPERRPMGKIPFGQPCRAALRALRKDPFRGPWARRLLSRRRRIVRRRFLLRGNLPVKGRSAYPGSVRPASQDCAERARWRGSAPGKETTRLFSQAGPSTGRRRAGSVRAKWMQR
jgi:hypothetical protein